MVMRNATLAAGASRTLGDAHRSMLRLVGTAHPALLAQSRFAALPVLVALMFAAGALMVGVAESYAATIVPPGLKGVGFDQRLGEQVPLDATFVDDAGREVKLGEYLSSRPAVLVLAYYQCPMLCTQVLNNLVLALRDVSFTPGRDFDVVVVSFDPRETTDIAAAKKKSYLRHYERPETEAGWHFLTGRKEPIKRLTEAVGFRYTYDAKRDQFAHASGIMLIAPSGKISRYFYDVNYRARDLRLGLVESSAGKIGSPVDQVLLYCFHYDPTAGKYGPAILNLVRLLGVLTMVAIGGLLWVLVRHQPKRPDAAAVEEPGHVG